MRLNSRVVRLSTYYNNMSANIDQLTPTESLIDLSKYTDSEFNLPDHAINTLFDDVILAEYVDVSPDGNAIKRGDIFIPLNTAPRAWRVGRVLMTGNNCLNVKPGDKIVFPGDQGIPISKLQYESVDGDIETVMNGIFLNEERLFGVCTSIADENSTTDTQSSS